jgi:hypothetical protein
MRTKLLFLAAFLLFAVSAAAQTNLIARDTTFAWDAITPPEGVTPTYRLCHSITSTDYTGRDCVDVGSVTQYTWNKALGAGRHYFVVYAMAIMNSQEVISGPSNEVSISLLPPTGGAGTVAP